MSGIRFTLADDPRAKAIYDRLIEEGVKSSDIDQGHFDISDLDCGRGRKPEFVGRGDGEIAPQEVYEYVLRHHKRYGDLLARHTGIYHPFALHRPSRRSEAQARVHESVKRIAKRSHEVVRAAGISRRDSRYFDAVFAVLYAAFDGDLESLPLMRDFLSQAKISEGVADIKLMAKAIFEGWEDCGQILPLHRRIDGGCRAKRDFDLNLFFLAMHEAGAKPVNAVVKRRGEDECLTEVGILDAGGNLRVPFADDLEWKVTSERISLGVHYVIYAEEAVKSSVDQIGFWAQRAELLLPEMIRPKALMGAWYLYRKDTDLLRAYEYSAKLHSMLPENVNAKMTLALVMANMGRHVEALPLFQEALESNVSDTEKVELMELTARSLFMLGRDEEALSAVQSLIDLDPSNYYHRNNMRRVLVALGRAEEALFQAGEAVRLAPDSMPMRYNLFFLLVEMGRPDDALEVAQEAWEINGSDPHSLVMRSVFLQGEGSHADSLKTIQRAIALGMDDFMSRYIEGMDYFMLRKYPKAVKSFDRSLSMDPRNDRARLMLAIALFYNDDYERAHEEMGRVDPAGLKEESKHYYLYYSSHLAMIQGELDEAAEFLAQLPDPVRQTAAVINLEYNILKARRDVKGVRALIGRIEALSQKHPELFAISAFHYNKERQYDKAAALCRRALELTPEDDFLKWQFAAAEFNLKNFKEAGRIARELAQSGKDRRATAYGHFIAGRVAWGLEGFEGAIADYEAAVALSIPEASPYAVLSGHYLESGDLDRAEDMLTRGLEISGGDARLYANFGVLLHKRGENARAVEFFDRAIEMLPDMIELYHARGVCRLLSSDYKGAHEDFARLGKKLWSNKDYASQYSYLLLHRGDSDGALKYARRALKLGPSNDLARIVVFQALMIRDMAQAEDFLEKNRDSFLDREVLALLEAFLAVRREDSQRLLKHAQAAIEANKSSVLGYNFLGIAKHALGDSKGAREAFRRALEIEPGYQPAKDNLAVTTWRDGGTLHTGPELSSGALDWSGYNFEDIGRTLWRGKDRSFWEIKPLPVLQELGPRQGVPYINDRMIHALDSDITLQEGMRRFGLW